MSDVPPSPPRPRRSLALLSLVLPGLLLACDARTPGSAGSAPPPAATPASAASAASAAAPRPPTDPQVDFLEILTGGARAEDTLPMVVAIHGLGDKPESFASLLSGFDRPARLVVPRGLDAYHGGYSWFPLRGNLEADEVARGILKAADALAATLRRVAAARPTRGKPIVTGFSQGGALSFALALRYPDLIRAALPIGGWVPPPVLPAAGAPIAPIVALHGEDDALVPIGPTRDAIAQIQQRGVGAELRAYEGVDHAVSAAMRRDLMSLLRQQLDLR